MPKNVLIFLNQIKNYKTQNLIRRPNCTSTVQEICNIVS